MTMTMTNPNQKPVDVPCPHCGAGPGAVIGKPPYNCKDIERLLLALRERVGLSAPEAG